MMHPPREQREKGHYPPLILPTEEAEGEGSPPLMIGGGEANETEEKSALRSASGSTPLFVGEVGVETIVVDSHVVKVPILIESLQMTFRC
jgi:hypothetical protein